MMILPRDVGQFRLLRKLGTGPVSESYEGIDRSRSDERVVLRRILPFVLQDRSRMTSVQARVEDLLAVRHPFLVQVLDWVAVEGEQFIVEEWVDGVDLGRLLAWCQHNKRPIAPNIYLNVATQVCNGLEALHGRPGKSSGAENVLHLGLRPSAIILKPDNRIQVGSYGLSRSPTALSHGAASEPVPTPMEYLSPEQTQSDERLGPSSDIFALGSILFELQTHEALFRGETSIQTIQRIRNCDISSQLPKIQETLPGLDKILTRALSLNPQHRYQRAFVLREDLRGLMAGYSFSNISEETTSFLEPILKDSGETTGGQSLVDAAPDAPAGTDDFAEDSSTRIDPDPISTAAEAARAAAARAVAESKPIVTETSFPKDDRLPTMETEADSPAPMIAKVPFGTGTEEDSLDVGPPTLLSSETEALVAENDPSALGLEEAPEPQESSSSANESEADYNLHGEPTRDLPPPTPEQEPVEAPRSMQPSPAQVQVHTPESATPTPPEPSEPLAPPTPEPAPPQDSAPEITAAAPPPYESPVNPVHEDAALEPTGAISQEDGTPHWDVSDDSDLSLAPTKNRLPLVAAGLAGLVLVLVVLNVIKTSSSEGPETVKPEEPALAELSPPAEEATPTEEDSEAQDDPTEEAVEAPAPEPVATPPEVKPAAKPAPRPAPVRPSASRPTRSPTPRASTPSYFDDGPATADVASLDQTEGEDVLYVVPERTDVDGYASSAADGRLSRGDIQVLESIQPSDGSYTRSRALLLMHSEKTKNSSATGKYLSQIMSLEENRCDPVFLSKRARWYANQKKYRQALKEAQRAEQHWARIPPELQFETKMEIFEVPAASQQGLFYASEDDLEILDKAIKAWKKYGAHAQGRQRMDLVARAEEQISKLEYAKGRLE
ncbi:MAG: protein kinase [Myxococcota bacterium]|nr:protein kinase [Myxococcota bacterium]